MKNDLPEILALEGLLREQRAAYLRSPYPSWEQRAAHRKALREVLLDNRDALADAMHADFGNRAKEEILWPSFCS
jgi:aldehyde dehydrogenase (NAD+)/coniferyl-aldehyde dehydrogenase